MDYDIEIINAGRVSLGVEGCFVNDEAAINCTYYYLGRYRADGARLYRGTHTNPRDASTLIAEISSPEAELATHSLSPTPAKKRAPTPSEMADRIKEIARLRAANYSNTQIADALRIKKKTLEMTIYKYEITKDGKILDPEGTYRIRTPGHTLG
jgi:hypothetical protein